MKLFRWSAEENLALEAGRGITFEQVVIAIGDGGLPDVYDHPDQEKYPNQRILVVACDSYAFLVPYIESDDQLFLKAIIPSRKAARDYLRNPGHPEGEQR